MSRRKGLHYEQEAERYLTKQGLRSIARNYSCRGGEIDLIMEDAGTLCFIEVKFRANHAFGGTAYSITAAKQKKILHCALHFIACTPAFQQSNYRFDAVFIEPFGQHGLDVEWLPNAFSVET